MKGEIGVKVGEGALVVARLQTPIGVEVPIDEVNDLTVAFGLEFIVETKPNDVLAVDGIDRVIIRIFDREQSQAGQFVIELRNVVSSVGVGSGNEDVINRGLDDVAKAIGIQQAAVKFGPDTR